MPTGVKIRADQRGLLEVIGEKVRITNESEYPVYVAEFRGALMALADGRRPATVSVLERD